MLTQTAFILVSDDIHQMLHYMLNYTLYVIIKGRELVNQLIDVNKLFTEESSAESY